MKLKFEEGTINKHFMSHRMIRKILETPRSKGGIPYFIRFQDSAGNIGTDVQYATSKINAINLHLMNNQRNKILEVRPKTVYD